MHIDIYIDLHNVMFHAECKMSKVKYMQIVIKF